MILFTYSLFDVYQRKTLIFLDKRIDMKKVARATARDHEKPSEILTVFARFF